MGSPIFQPPSILPFQYLPRVLLKLSDVYKMTCYCSRSCHLRTDEMRTATFSLSAFKVPVSMCWHTVDPASRYRDSCRGTYYTPLHAIQNLLLGKPCQDLLSSAWRLTACEPGTTIALTVSATFLPFATSAAARKSLIREFVQLPMKTRSTGISVIGVPGWRSIYAKACSAARLSSVVVMVCWVRDTSCHIGYHTGVCAPCYLRRNVCCVEM